MKPIRFTANRLYLLKHSRPLTTSQPITKQAAYKFILPEFHSALLLHWFYLHTSQILYLQLC